MNLMYLSVEDSTSTRRVFSFDALKGLSCIAIVLIHYNFVKDLDWLGQHVMVTFRFAVPVFLMVSGYFLSRTGIQFDDHAVAKKLRHIFILTIKATLFYLVFCFVWNSLAKRNFSFAQYLVHVCSSDNVFKFILTNRPFVYGHFWFLWALIYCYLTCCFLGAGLCWRLLVFVAPLSLVLTAISQELAGVVGIHPVFRLPGGNVAIDFAHVFVCRALPFFLLGAFFRRFEHFFVNLKIPAFYLVILAVLGCCFANVEYLLLGGKKSQFYVGTTISAIVLFVLAMRQPQMKLGVLAWVGRELSLLIFILHVAVGKSYDLMGQLCHFYGHAPYYILRMPVVLVVTILVAWIIRNPVRALWENCLRMVSRLSQGC